MPEPGRTTLRLLLIGALCSVLAACGLSAPGGGPSMSSSEGRAAPALADVETLSDPKSWQGASTAVVAGGPVEPVATSPEPSLPATVTDAQDTEVTVEDTSRILALDVYGTLSRTVYDLGFGDSVVGRDISTQFDEAADLPLVTQNGHDLNAEAILELDPTLILTDTSLGPWDVILQMRDIGIPVVVTDSERSLGNVDDITHQVAAALGVPALGDRLVKRTAKQIDAVEEQIAQIAPGDVTDKLRTIFLYVRGQAGVYYLFGEGSGADSLIDALGLYDVAEEIDWSGMKPVTDEAIISAQPELVLMMSGGLDSVGGVEGLIDKMPALANTPAGENERFVDMADSQVLGFGPAAAQVLNALAVAIYAPEAVR